MKFYFLLEELSMELFLRDLLCRMFPSWEEEVDFCLRPYGGKDALKRGVQPFIRAVASKAEIRAIIIHDQDEANCAILKNDLQSLASEAKIPVFIPIPCRELEAWYLGDIPALSQTYGEFEKVSNKKAFRTNPDIIKKPSRLIQSHIVSFSKTDAARKMGKIINLDKTRSQSFQYFIARLRNFVAEGT